MLANKVIPMSPSDARIAELEKENKELQARIETLEYENVCLSLQDTRSMTYYKLWRRTRK